jgi:hypothetical protein
MSVEQTKAFLAALERDLKPLRRAITELDGLWGKGIGTKGGVDKKVLDALRGLKSGLDIQAKALERLAAGEVPE